mgnify:CR=1 FL=1
MELFIQMGHNMQALALEHLEEFDGGTIIISPMNILPNKVKGYATRVHKKKGKVLVDPQLYYPRQYQKNCLSMHIGRRVILHHWKWDNLIR